MIRGLKKRYIGKTVKKTAGELKFNSAPGFRVRLQRFIAHFSRVYVYGKTTHQTTLISLRLKCFSQH